MRLCVAVCLALGLVLAAGPVRAQEAEVLRRELEQLKQQFQTMQEQYQSMSERLQRLEAQPPAAPAPAAPAGLPSLVELARPREPFALYERRGAGQLLFDMGVTGDFAGSLTSKSVE